MVSQGRLSIEDEEAVQHESRYQRRERRTPTYFSQGSASLARALAVKDSTLPNQSTVVDLVSQEFSADWKEAINSELESLKRHETWEVVDMPKGAKLLSTRFIFLHTYDDKGKLIRHKARLVARGYLQGILEHTFAPVVDFNTVRTCLALALQRG